MVYWAGLDERREGMSVFVSIVILLRYQAEGRRRVVKWINY